ncbi:MULTISPECIES: hypothetical protein [unclassified Microcoleus]|uniref:hypothetical protein n=1 Tax=unclassified Microcoleus TaxID=2642155 RepID=UPI002FD6F93A
MEQESQIDWRVVKIAISKLEESIEVLDRLGYSVVNLEETKNFQALTQHTLNQIVLDLEEYVNAVSQASSQIAP